MARAIAKSGIPVVDVLGVVAECSFPLVHVDNWAVARMAAEHLRERGLENFGFFGIEDENWSDQRYAAFCGAVAPNPVAFYELPRQALMSRSWEKAEDRLAQWVKRLPKPAGVFICSDQRGALLLEACRRAGVLVPDDVAVIGVDDDEPLCEACDPPLSSVQPGHPNVGYYAAALLDRLLGEFSPPREPLLLPPEEVIARFSTDMLAVPDRSLVAALRLIRDHAHLGLTVERLARHVGVSRSVLQRRFRSLLKRSIHDEIVAARIKQARDLLTKTDLPLSTVAERPGFKHQEYMGAVFKARLATTPARLRRGSASLAGRR